MAREPLTVVESEPIPAWTLPPFALSAQAVAASLGVDGSIGLDGDRIASRLNQYGANVLAEPPVVPVWRRFLAQFNEFVIWILIAAAVISGLLNEWIDAAAIIAIVLLNGFLGFFQEEKAGRALAELKRLAAPCARVLRSGALRILPASELVPGDCLELEEGDHIPADVRLLHSSAFRVQESALTGESVPVDKVAACILPPQEPLGDRRNMAYLGTVVVAGKASGVVVATGMNTEVGRIAGLLRGHRLEPTPLQRRLSELGRILVGICFGIVGVVFALEYYHGDSLLDVFLVSVSLAVAAVPEGLPAVVTMALALGLQRMARRHALIRKLPSVETLGCVTVICADKTGTLTKNEMTVCEIFAGGVRHRVTGSGYEPRGQILQEGDLTAANSSAGDLELVLRIGLRCNNARLVSPGEPNGLWQMVGDPTEAALIVAARKAGLDETEQAPVLDEIAFDAERKRMSVIVRTDHGPELYCKGAPEAILKRCSFIRRRGRVEPLSKEDYEGILRECADMAARTLRVLALASRVLPRHADGDPETDLVFVGLAGMMDPLRDEAKEAVKRCRNAGIRPVLITGDHPATALAIGRELGIATAATVPVLGPDLDRLDNNELADRVKQAFVYARVSPEHKQRIVRAWKACGHVVAMTGDGINDAPAIQAADVGIAMGRSGTDVCRAASDMVLTDDNFATIVNAVEEGRGIYDNIQKVLQYLLSCNSGELMFVLGAGLLGWPVPLAPVQLLWINLVTDGFPALALAVEPPEAGSMQRRPRPLTESILPLRTGVSILLQGMLVALVALIAFGAVYDAGREESEARARALTFSTLVFAELLRALAARSWSVPLFRMGVFTNPWLLASTFVSVLFQLAVVAFPVARPVFQTVAPTTSEWTLLIGLAFIPVTVIELAKLVRTALYGSGNA